MAVDLVTKGFSRGTARIMDPLDIGVSGESEPSSSGRGGVRGNE
jgi:hypothetical protein